MKVSDEIRQFLSKIGSKGGSAKTDKKVKASKTNGSKGGRPVKNKGKKNESARNQH